jgi:hypothetical protein
VGFAEQVVRQYEYEEPGRRLAHFVGGTGTHRVALFSSIDPRAPYSLPSFQVLTTPKAHPDHVDALAAYTSESRAWLPYGVLIEPDGGDYQLFMSFERYTSGSRRWPLLGGEIVIPEADSIVPLVEIPTTERTLAAVLLAEGFRSANAPV